MWDKKYTDYIDVDLEQKLDENHHLGHIFLESFKKKQPEDIAQINGATDEQETYGSLYRRTVRLARSLTNFGCKPGDVVILTGINHLDIAVPFYAGMINGLPVCGVDPAYKYAEIESAVNLSKPKIVFCDYMNKENYEKAKKELGIDMTVVTFIEGELTMQKFIEKYDDNMPIDDFKPPTYDPNETYAWLLTTRGTNGPPKLCAVKQTTAAKKINLIYLGKRLVTLVLYHVHWVYPYLIRCASILSEICIVMTSRNGDTDHIIDIINKYKPQRAAYCPTSFALIMQNEKPCDWTCFQSLTIFGMKAHENVTNEIKKRMHPNSKLIEVYGQSEGIGKICSTSSNVPPKGSCGKMETGIQAKLLNENGEEIKEPFVPGELLYKGIVFDGYYNDPEETAKVFTEDGWLKTGDLFYRDESDNYFFVDRLKMLIRNSTTRISPTELEDFIRQHPSVHDVCVTSIDHPTDQQWPVAVVVKRPGSNITAQEIKDIVAEKNSDGKKLRGGVVFVDELPLTTSGKVDRMVIRTIAKTANRE